MTEAQHLSTESPDTRQRLLEAAGETFAELGFRSATVRDICLKAGANVAAINYHFRDKEGLYLAVMRYAHQCALTEYAPEANPQVNGDPERALADFVRAMMLRIYDTGRPAWHGKLLAREMAEPTAALDDMVEHFVRPHAALLGSIIRALLGPGAPDELVRFCLTSVIGQCLHYFHSRPVISRLFPQFTYQRADIDRLAAHIVGFSLAGIRSLAPPSGGGKGTRA